ncbi:endonuclease III [Pancytospora epiphaga]|nr:endonuclease III [Pancytospora epiphaga]
MDLYRRIKGERGRIKAPVDTIGCASVGDNFEGDEKKFRILIALLLSSQTKDEVTYDAICQLDSRLSGLRPERITESPIDVVHSCISKVGYHNKKLKYLIEISKQLKNKKMPDSLEKVVALPGIGKKMAYLYLQHACGVNAGIGVDTHVLRISRRIGLSNSVRPEGVRRDLEQIFETEEWPQINKVLVGFGQVICTAVSPHCADCPVKDCCPASRAMGE